MMLSIGMKAILPHCVNFSPTNGSTEFHLTKYLGLLDLSGIQSYILREPLLKQIAARSEYIEAKLETAYKEAADDNRVQILVIAGGNASFLSDGKAALQAVFAQITRDLLENTDGLFAVTYIQEYAQGGLPNAVKIGLRHIENRKFTQERDTRFAFPSLVPAGGKIPKAKTDTDEPLNLDEMICRNTSQEQTNLMAVVTLDGLGMGKKTIDWLNSWRDSSKGDDPSFANEYKAWSQHLKTRWKRAWQSAKDEIYASFSDERGITSLPFHYDTQDPTRRAIAFSSVGRVPCRRIYQGGDDLTFVCDARIALSLTATLMRTLNTKEAVEDLGNQENVAYFHRIPTSAGIVFVGRSFPFARAVQMADGVRKKAKIVAMQGHEGPQPTLDWWMNRQGMAERPTPIFEGANLKPYRLEMPLAEPSEVSKVETPLTWDILDKVFLRTVWKVFGERRGKWKDIIAAAESADVMQQQKTAQLERLLTLRPVDGAPRNGQTVEAFQAFGKWIYSPITGFAPDGSTPLLDLAELFDVHYPFHSPTTKPDVTDEEAAP